MVGHLARPRFEILVSLAAGVVAALICWTAYRLPPPSTSDFDQIWVAAHAVVRGLNPYEVVPRTGTHFPLFYPLPAALVAVPLAGFPLAIARIVWALISGAVFTWATLRRGGGLVPGLLSASFLNALIQGQWSPLLTAAAVVPALSWIWIAKPSVGAALFLGYPNRRAIVGGLMILGLSLLIAPSWPRDWLSALQLADHVAPPVTRPGGALLLLALIRWRLPQARMLVGLACVPQTIGLYETLPLFLIPRTRWEGYGFAALTYVAAFAQALMVPRLDGMTLGETLEGRWPILLVCLYLPAIVLVLLTREPRVEPDSGSK
jgi:hypothetical protein